MKNNQAKSTTHISNPKKQLKKNMNQKHLKTTSFINTKHKPFNERQIKIASSPIHPTQKPIKNYIFHKAKNAVQ